jgi:hypothetical protein
MEAAKEVQKQLYGIKEDEKRFVSVLYVIVIR